MKLQEMFWWIIQLGQTIGSGATTAWTWLTSDLQLGSWDIGKPILWIGGSTFFVIIVIVIVKGVIA